MRYEDWRQAEIEDRRPLGQRFTLMPIGGYTDATGAGPLQQAWNTTAAGMGADLPPPGYVDPAVLAGYRPRGRGGPDRPPAQPIPTQDPDYRPRVGPERDPDEWKYQDPMQQLQMLRMLYGR